MKLFLCPNCSSIVYFENRACGSCGQILGYDPPSNSFQARDEESDLWRPSGAPTAAFRFCANAEQDVCNWLIAGDDDATLCIACRHNHTIPDLSVPGNLARWRKLELAKHHLFYGLSRLGLPLETRLEQPAYGLTFDFLADDLNPANVLTGHQDGIITLNLAEADDAIREQRRSEMGEPYRTLLGHFRHETGHYYWDRLVRDSSYIRPFRELFGDETRNYDEALKTYYAEGPPPVWWDNFVSAYASAHPWEDFAETWAHYLHIADTLEMAGSHGMRVHPAIAEDPALNAEVDLDPWFATDIHQLINRWRPIAIAVNSVNRCMGQPDLYPFVLTPSVIAKLGFIHDVTHGLNRPKDSRRRRRPKSTLVPA